MQQLVFHKRSKGKSFLKRSFKEVPIGLVGRGSFETQKTYNLAAVAYRVTTHICVVSRGTCQPLWGLNCGDAVLLKRWEEREVLEGGWLAQGRLRKGSKQDLFLPAGNQPAMKSAAFNEVKKISSSMRFL